MLEMSFTIFSFITAFIFSTFILVSVHLLRKNPSFIRKFGVKSVLIGYLLCLLRMLFTPEFSFTMTIELPKLVNGFYEKVYIEPIYVMSKETSYFSLFLGVWCSASLLLVIIFAVQYGLYLLRISRYSTCTSERIERILSQVQSEYPRRIRAEAFICPETAVPMGIGLWKKRILLPYGKYSDQELYYIIKHEYTHFYNRDLTVKFLVIVFCCIFWWNPAAYLLLRDISQILEIKCDLAATQNFSHRKKEEYLGIILNLLKDQGNGPQFKIIGALGMIKFRNNKSLVERFQVVMKPPQSVHKWVLPVIVTLYLIAFGMSYMAVIQPRFNPLDKDEMISDNGKVETILEGYIIKEENGDYILYSPGEEPYKIKEETAQIFISLGMEFREDLIT